MTSKNRMRRWLSAHQRCRVLMVEDNGVVWVVDLAGCTGTIRLEEPSLAALIGALRKIFWRVTEVPVESVEIAA